MIPMLMTPVAIAATACTGADPSITNVTTTQVAGSGDLSTYALKVTVANIGSSDQPKNLLQSVDIFLDGGKKDEKGLPPLAAGADYSFTYDVRRAADAGNRTSTVRLHLVTDRPAGDAAQSCSMANTDQRVVF
jgi:hypothetical protein